MAAMALQLRSKHKALINPSLIHLFSSSSSSSSTNDENEEKDSSSSSTASWRSRSAVPSSEPDNAKPPSPSSPKPLIGNSVNTKRISDMVAFERIRQKLLQSLVPIGNETPGADNQFRSPDKGMTSSSKDAAKRTNVCWTPEMCDIAITVLVEEVMKGRKTDNGFHQEAYNAVSKEIKDKLGIDVDKSHIYNKYKSWRKLVLIVRNFREESGFGWDKHKEMVVADHHVWEDYFQSHPDLRGWEKKRVERFDELDIIIGRDTTSGKTAQAGIDRRAERTQSQSSDYYYPNMNGLGEFASHDVEDFKYENMETPESVRRETDVSTGSRHATSVQRSTRKRKAKDNAIEACDRLAVAIEKLATSLEMNNNFTRAKLLKQAIKSVDGFNREETSRAFHILARDEFKALDFWSTEEDERAEFLRSLLDAQLNQRLAKLREIEEKETESRTDGDLTNVLKDSLAKLRMSSASTTKSSSSNAEASNVGSIRRGSGSCL